MEISRTIRQPPTPGTGWPHDHAEDETAPVSLRVDWLRGPRHDWLLVASGLHADLHDHGYAHEHPEETP